MSGSKIAPERFDRTNCDKNEDDVINRQFGKNDTRRKWFPSETVQTLRIRNS
jgi:hypothetical protein